MISTLLMITPLLGLHTETPVQTVARTAPIVQQDATLAALRMLDDSSLSGLRAGAPALAQPIAPSEREELQRASANTEDLAALRAGELSNNDLQVVGLVALAVLVLIVIF